MHRVKVFRILLMLLFLSLYFAAFSAAGTVPQLINYQGNLTDTAGNPVPDGQYGVVFNIYDVATGGTSLWTETWNANTIPVVTVKGNFNAMLGTHNPIPSSFFSDHSVTYLGIKVGNDSEMMPRQRISSVAYAFTAGTGVPRGGIIMWSGAIDQIPEGWALCNGVERTLPDGTKVTPPNLKDKFILGAGGTLPATGGSMTRNLSHYHTTANHTLTAGEIPNHRHSFLRIPKSHNEEDHDSTYLSGTGGGNAVSSWITDYTAYIGGDAAHNHGDTGSAGSTVQDIMPPYYALAFIMKL